jgi:hypothetical protein
MWHILLLRDKETLGGLAMYYPFRIPLRPVIKDTLCIIGYRHYRSPRIFYYVVVS